MRHRGAKARKCTAPEHLLLLGQKASGVGQVGEVGKALASQIEECSHYPVCLDLDQGGAGALS